MRRVDRWLGVPMCAMLSLVRRSGALVGRAPARPVERIIFIKLAEMGSTVLAAQAIHRAIDRVGRENVYFLLFEENRPILDILDLVPRENVIEIRAKRLASAILTSLGAVVAMRRRRIDAAIDMEFFARSSAIFTYLSGASTRVGLHAYDGEGPYRGDLMTHRVRFNPHMHSSQTFRAMVDALDADPELLPTTLIPAAVDDGVLATFRPAPEEIDGARRIIVHAAETESFSPLVLLNPNCSDLIPLRAWPRDRYVDLAHQLLASRPDVRIGLTGAPSEAPEADKLVAEIGSDRCFSLAGKTTLRELMVIYGLADVLVTNDSGPAHFATLTPIDVVTLFGPETPALFAAQSERNHVFWAGLACSPCVSAYNNRHSRCTNNLCMQSIRATSVLEVVCRVLDARTSPAEESRDVHLDVVVPRKPTIHA